jgi:hypothetical protein
MNRMRLALTILTCVVTSSTVLGQMAAISPTLTWQEVYSNTVTPVSNPNGVLEPGESALVTVTISFTPVGTPVQVYIPSSAGVAPVGGLRSSRYILEPNHAHGTWLYAGTTAPYFPWGAITEPNGQLWVTVQQLPQPAPWLPDPTNPVQWRGVWTPDVYDERQASFTPVPDPFPGPGQVFVILSLEPPVYGFALADQLFGTPIHIPIVPAPGAAAAALGLGVALARRKRT